MVRSQDEQQGSSSSKIWKGSVLGLLLVMLAVGLVGTALITANKVQPSSSSTDNIAQPLEQQSATGDRDAGPGSEPKQCKARSLFRNDDPDDFGYVKIFVRESCDEDRFRPVRFPFARFARHRLSISSRLTRYSRRLSIFADSQTRQTIIFTRSGVYFLPAMVNKRRKLFSLAVLLADGYASFSSRGSALSSCRSIDECFYPEKASHRRLSQFNSKTRRFVGGIKTEYSSNFKSDCYGGDSDADDNSYDEDRSSEDQGGYQRYEKKPQYNYDEPSYQRPQYPSNAWK